MSLFKLCEDEIALEKTHKKESKNDEKKSKSKDSSKKELKKDKKAGSRMHLGRRRKKTSNSPQMQRG
jgi:hypothetical protein